MSLILGAIVLCMSANLHLSISQQRSPNFYDLLNIPRDSDLSTIKKAFRVAARDYHPDKNPSPEAQETYHYLTNSNELITKDGGARKFIYDYFLISKTEEVDSQNKLSGVISTYPLKCIPFYLSWLLLSIVFIRTERTKAKLYIMILIVGSGAYEMMFLF